jgi:hypothetical protein
MLLKITTVPISKKEDGIVTKTTIGTLLVVLLFSLSFVPSCIYSADPRMEDVFREQRNDVHSLAANMQQALKAEDEDSQIENIINQSLQFRYEEEVTFGYKDDKKWKRGNEEGGYIDTFERIRSVIQPNDFDICVISIEPGESPFDAYYDSHGNRYSREEARDISMSIQNKIDDKLGATRLLVNIDPDNPSDESIYRWRELEAEVDKQWDNHPGVPKATPLAEYEVNIIPNGDYRINFKAKEVENRIGISSQINLYDYDGEIEKEDRNIGGW